MKINRQDRNDFEIRHKPVMPAEVLAARSPQPGQLLVDCTLGLAGHSRLLLDAISPGGTLVSTDFDPANIARAADLARSSTASRFIPVHSNFAGLPGVLSGLGIDRVDGILADLGVASPQIDDPARGFSYRKPGPLDMRMDSTRAASASDLLAKISEDDLRDALLELGDETDAPQIARLIVQRRSVRPITTTGDLMAIVCQARDFTLQRAAGAKLHPAARTFQALRMLVNRETQNLERLLAVAPSILKPRGRLVIISFHSGEDRRVKQSFRQLHRDGVYARITADPVLPGPAEIKQNPRSRSAKLRWAQVK